MYMRTDCFVISGSKVLEGVGSYVVVAVGTESFNGCEFSVFGTPSIHTQFYQLFGRTQRIPFFN